jgi:tRNA (guanine37-N1)-methyltransferase
MAKLKQVLLKSKILTKKQSSLVPTSFDVVGDIAIFNDFPKELKSKEKLIAKKLLEIHKNIKTVAKKSKIYSGKLRTPKITIIAGEKRKTTIHKESNCSFALDVEKCYFSTRSSSERLRITKKIKKGESILVMFSGVAPLPCVLSKNTNAKEIYAIELNNTAHKFAKENLKLNKINNITLYQGDVKTILPKLKKRFDRILMPLPKNAPDYLDLAKKALKPKGTIHLYTFSNQRDFKLLKKKYKQQFKSVSLIKAGHYAPGTFRICLDLKK